MGNRKKWYPMPRFLLRKDALKQILKNLDLKDKKVLEIGYGAGEILKLFAMKKAIVSGYDFSEQARTIVNSRLANFKFKTAITLYEKSECFESSQFDFLVALEVLEHIEDDHAALEKWLSWVKPGGSLIFSVPAHMEKWCLNDEWAGHIKRYEKIEFERLTCFDSVSGFKVLNYGYPIILLLDTFLNKVRKTKETSTFEMSDEEKTMKSGLDRPQKLIYKLLSNDVFLYPFYLIQRLFFNKDLGSGYIVHVVKK